MAFVTPSVANTAYMEAAPAGAGGVRAFFDRSFTLGQSLAWTGMVLALLTLGAHFYRAGEYGLALCLVGAVVFTCLESSWKQYAVALLLLWGSVEWMSSAYGLAVMRVQMGMPWMRGAAILLAVALATGLAGKYAFSRALRKDTRQGSSALLQGMVFICVFLLLFYMRQSAELHFLLLERYFPLLGSVQIFFAAWYAAFITEKLASPRQSKNMRVAIWSLFGVFFFAQFFLGLIGFDKMLLTGKLHVPVPAFIIFAPVFRESMSIMPFIVMAASLLVGGAWCSMLCYFGPFDALAAGKKGVRPYPPALRRLLPYGRWFVLASGVSGALLLRSYGISASAAVSIAVVYAGFSLMAMAALSRKYSGMAHCTIFCPMGVVASMLGRISPWRVRVDSAACDNCGACEKLCKYAAINTASRERGKTLTRCSLCRDCIGGCKQKALYMHFPGLSREKAWTVFTGLIAAVHTVFLSVAMV